MAESFDTYPIDVDSGPRRGIDIFFEEILSVRLTVQDAPYLFPPYALLVVETGGLPMVATVLWRGPLTVLTDSARDQYL